MIRNTETASAILFCVSLLILGFWVVYVARNSFEIILPGLKISYYIFILHLAFLIISVLLSTFVRFHFPRSDYGLAFWIWPRVCKVILYLLWYFASMFGYQKAKIYLQMYIPGFKSFFSIVVHYLGAALCIVSVFATKTGGYSDNGNSNEVQDAIISSLAQYVMSTLCIFHYLTCNLVVLYVILRYVEPIKDSLPALEPQFQVHVRFVPFLVLSNCFLVVILALHIIQKNNSLSILWPIWFLDSLLNNAIMHYTVFAHVEFIHGEQGIRALIEARDLEEFDESEERVYWVAMPGLQPIQVGEELVREMCLWDHVVTDENVLLQIDRFKNMSCYSMLCWTCNTDDELLSMIEMVE